MKLTSALLSAALLGLPALTSATLTADAIAAPAPLQSADHLAGRVQAFYNRTQTFQADFTQRYTIKAYSRTKDSSGKVTFEKPGKMSWRYTTNGNRVVSDGKVLRVYEEENKQMYEQAMDQSQYPAALAFLVGEGDIRASFKLQVMDSEKAKFEGGYVLVGEPRQPTPAYQKMLLFVDAKTDQVRRVMLIDAQGNRNRFDFANPVVNKKPPPDEFRFTPPKGTKIIKP
jgi:outer membrane lipoprotein carrier protein